MKKISLFAVVGALVAFSARAEFQAPTAPVPQTTTTTITAIEPLPGGGFVAETEKVVSVSQVKDMRDDVRVVMVGRIIQSVDDNKYLFTDETDTVTLEIDPTKWAGQTITPNDQVKIYGETDRGIFTTEVEVERIQKM